MAGRKRRGPPFAKVYRERLVKSPAWRELTNTEFRLYVYLKAKHNGYNNGEITLKYSEIEDIMSRKTISKVLKGLIEKGWIKKTQLGGLCRYYCLYELTWRHDDP